MLIDDIIHQVRLYKCIEFIYGKELHPINGRQCFQRQEAYLEWQQLDLIWFAITSYLTISEIIVCFLLLAVTIEIVVSSTVL